MFFLGGGQHRVAEVEGGVCVSLCSSRGSALSQRLVLSRTGAVLQSPRSVTSGTLNQLHDPRSCRTVRPSPSPSWEGSDTGDGGLM